MYHEDADVDVVELARHEGGHIVGHSFKNCLLHGPAVLAVAASDVIIHQRLDYGQIWPLEIGRPYMGQIDLVESRIEDCKFDRVGFAFPPKRLAQLPLPSETGAKAVFGSMPNMSVYLEEDDAGEA
ncbi:hypothetical protein SAMN04515680_1876 [Leifsonia sp. 21MFCrub1.1]|nr:hypothetical protein SAMN04515680_1876 [Leifsonia sp. 21MFCrub1.1]